MKCTIRTLNRTGDSELKYDTAVKEEISLAEAFFNEHVKTKPGSVMAFGVIDGESTLIREFDEKYEEIVIAPRLAGG